MQKNDLGLITFSSQDEINTQNQLLSLLETCPIPKDEILQNLGLFITSKLFSRLLFLQHIYLLQLQIHGVIMDFGTRWGQNMVIFSILRGIYEPFNRIRKIIGFDTFEGFVDEKESKLGDYKTTKNYERYLSDLLVCQENLNPINHIKKYEIIKGDATKTLREYLDKYPSTMISLAYFDMDLQSPTFQCLKMIQPYLYKGSVIGFDELCDETFPGETKAFKEIFGQKYTVNRLPITSRTSYIVL